MTANNNIKMAEEADSSAEPDLLSGLESYVPPRSNKIASITEISFDSLLDPPLLLQEDLKKGCGGQLWPAGMVLAKYMLQYHRDDIADQTILELGAGGGLVGLAVAQGCQTTKPFLITDQQPMLSLMRQNIALNSLEGKVIAEILDWGSEISPSIKKHVPLVARVSEEGHYPDVVLAADCVYFEPAFPLLLETMQQLLGPTTVCYFCFKKRRKADWRFVRDMKKKFKVVDAEYEDQERDRREGIYLYEVRKV